MNKYKITVLICTWNRADVIDRCFDALEKQTLGTDNFEVLIIDNNSTDNTAALVKERAEKGPLHIRYVLEDRQGQSFARNRALDEARTEYAQFLDDDCLARPDCLELMYNALSETGADIVCGKTINIYPDTMPKIIEYGMPYVFPTYTGKRRVMPNALGTTGNMGLKVAFARGIRFSKELGYVGDKKVGGEDTDFCLRARAAGGVFVVEPSSICDHLIQAHRINFPDRWRTSYAYGIMRARIAVKERKMSAPKRLAMFAFLAATAAIQAPFVLISFLVPHYALRSFLRFARYCGRAHGFLKPED